MREGMQMKKLNVTHAIYEGSEHNLKECKRWNITKLSFKFLQI